VETGGKIGRRKEIVGRHGKRRKKEKGPGDRDEDEDEEGIGHGDTRDWSDFVYRTKTAEESRRWGQLTYF
jgi:hypothetical protein